MSRMYQMQATDIDIQRMQVRRTKQQVVSFLLQKHWLLLRDGQPLDLSFAGPNSIDLPASSILNSRVSLNVDVQMRILSKSTGNSEEVLEKEINRPRYFSPQTAIDFGIIDRVRHHLNKLTIYPNVGCRLCYQP